MHDRATPTGLAPINLRQLKSGNESQRRLIHPTYKPAWKYAKFAFKQYWLAFEDFEIARELFFEN